MAFVATVPVGKSYATKEEDSTSRLQVGEWRQDKSRRQTRAPFQTGLGMPWWLSAAAPIADAITLDITIKVDGDTLEASPLTFFLMLT